MGKIKKLFLILLVIAIGWYISAMWQYWTQDVDYWKAQCAFPEKSTHVQTVFDYKMCLAFRRITPTDKDIRKMCSYHAQDQYYAQASTEPSVNSLYQNCVHAEGLTD